MSGINVKCPACGLVQLTHFDAEAPWRTKLVTCDIESGGCDEEFALVVEATFSPIVYRLSKVES
jgi:hypothetical protein